MNIIDQLPCRCSLTLGWLASPNKTLQVVSVRRLLGLQLPPQLGTVQMDLFLSPSLKKRSHERDVSLYIG